VLRSVDYYFASKSTFTIKQLPSTQDPKAEILQENINIFYPESFLSAFDCAMKTESIAKQVYNIMASGCPQKYAKNFPEV
jgi:hypothetical protein